MNPRVKELAEQAGGVVLAGSEIQKFAELIVAECTKILADNSEFRGCVIISKHFGVEK